MTEATVYVGERATLEQVRAAVEAFQRQTGDPTTVYIDADADGYPGMGFAIDVYGKGAENAAYRIADGIRFHLRGIPVVVERDLKRRAPAARRRR